MPYINQNGVLKFVDTQPGDYEVSTELVPVIIYSLNGNAWVKMVDPNTVTGIEGIHVSENGHLIFTMSNGAVLDSGDLSAAQNVSIAKMQVNDQGHLIVALVDGTVIDAGYVKGPQGAQGPAGEPGQDGLNAPQIDDTQASADNPWSGQKVQQELDALTAEDVGARPDTWTPTAENVGALPSDGTADNSNKLSGKTLSEIILTIYPVGSIYLSTVSTNPGTLFGGSWEAINDVFLLAAGSRYAAGSIGGEENVTLTTAQMPAHSHGFTRSGTSTPTGRMTLGISGEYGGGNYGGFTETIKALASATVNIENAGGGLPHNNMPPYLAVYTWKRVA